MIGKETVNIRLVLNYLIILYNVFDHAATHMLFFKICKEKWGTLAAFIVFLNRMPERLGEPNVILAELELDAKIIEQLNKI